MAFSPWLGLNCLTWVLVSASLWWMDGCQYDSRLFSLVCFALFGCILFIPSLLLLLLLLQTDSQFLCLQSSHCPCVSVSLVFFSWFSPSALPFSSHLCISLTFLSSLFPPLVCAVNCLPEQHVAGGERKKARVRREKRTLTKAPSPELACSCKKKYINYLHDWMM